MKIRSLRITGFFLATLALSVFALALNATPVSGTGQSHAISANQLQGTTEIRVGNTMRAVTSTATILSLVPGPGHTLVGTSSHTLDFGGGNTITTTDDGRLVPVNDQGLYQMQIKCTIVSGTGEFAGVAGDLGFTGRINLATGQVDWRISGQLR
jgi:hypothetical protein